MHQYPLSEFISYILADPRLYHSIVGALQYVTTVSRLELGFSVNKMCQFISQPMLWVLNTKIWVPFVMRIWTLEIDYRKPTYGASVSCTMLNSYHPYQKPIMHHKTLQTKRPLNRNRLQNKAEIKCPFEVSTNALDRWPVNLRRLWHKLKHLLYNIAKSETVAEGLYSQ
jgi:hypothetical protein